MIVFFRTSSGKIYAVGTTRPIPTSDLPKWIWLFAGSEHLHDEAIEENFIGPRSEMITPWSTNAVEITQTMGITGVERIEEFFPLTPQSAFDPMLQRRYDRLDQNLFTINRLPEPVQAVTDIAAYNKAEGLALNDAEIQYLITLSSTLGRPLTDSEVFGFSQINSEHCRHKIFNGTFIIDGETKPQSLFALIRETARRNPNFIVSAYKDNVAFIEGPTVQQFAPATQDKPDFFETKEINTVISLKAETHNFPTTVEPFNGAATGSGGEIRDRLAGGKGSIPLAGTAVYMTSYPRLDGERKWERYTPERKWLYHDPAEILTKASDGASDFGNKFGQPLITGSLFTFEHTENGKVHGFDKVIMLAGGIGFAKKEDSLKESLSPGDEIILLGGDNYRIGMGGGAVSSVSTGHFENALELNAVQRSNPEMQKRVMNAIRAFAESSNNPVISVHDHGAGGHLNCFSELLEETGGIIYLDKLPIGDPTLSDKEIISNESQERMGLAMRKEDADLLERIAARERAPFYRVGKATGDKRLQFKRTKDGDTPFDLLNENLFGSSPKTILKDTKSEEKFKPLRYDARLIDHYLNLVLQMEAVACKDWLTNKVDRCVTGKVATQQTCGPLQLPLNNAGVMTIDYGGHAGIGTSIGHATLAALIDPAEGSRLAIAEALTNLVWVNLRHGLKGVSLSANWMWPAKNEGENARLYEAVQAASEFSVALGINIPTGKDSLSMTQKYPDGEVVYSPGTVIISAVGEVEDVRKTVGPVLVHNENSSILYIDFTENTGGLGGSIFSQVVGLFGDAVPTVSDPSYFVRAFNAVQRLIKEELLLAGHDVSSGGLITTLLELTFSTTDIGIDADLQHMGEDKVRILFSENPGVVIQVREQEKVIQYLKENKVRYYLLGKATKNRTINLSFSDQTTISFDIDKLRSTWFRTSYLMDRRQRPLHHATRRFENLGKQPLAYHLLKSFEGTLRSYGINPRRQKSTGFRAAIIREKGVNGDREMAYCLYLAGFDVKDVHMTDLFEGRETLDDVNFIAFVGGFSNSDVLGSAKGWAGGFLFNERAKKSLDNFYKRKDTLSIGVCNGCQVMMELGLLYPEWKHHPRMKVNQSGKFESCFVTVDIPQNNSVMFGSLANTRMGIWVAHGEGCFPAPPEGNSYNVTARFSYTEYPGNPNGSDNAVAGLCSEDGRHLAIMPHLERSLFPWNWSYYPENRKTDEVSPWLEAFVNAQKWVVTALQK